MLPIIAIAFSWTGDTWAEPQGLPAGHNGGVKERLTTPAGGRRPHILMILFDDYGWADAGWHRNYTAPGGEFLPATPEVATPHLDSLVREGIELDRHYVYKYCSPSRSALQSGRNPYHVNPLNAEPTISNPDDPVSGFQGIPRNMTGLATKLAAAGYRTAGFGKWDAGMATPDHTPHGRGYQTALNYFHHCNDYWSFTDGGCPVPYSGGDKVPIVDLWKAGGGAGEGRLGEGRLGEGPAWGANNTCVRDCGCGCSVEVGPPAECAAGPLGDPWWGGYEDSLFEKHALALVEGHDAAVPLFLFFAPHIVHTPLQVPQEYADRFAFIAPTDKPRHQRQVYHAMVSFADDIVGNLTAAFKRKGMWDDTLVVFSTDNGGPVYGNGTAGANNFPLRGGKMNNWEGGIRGNAFVSGGFLPPSRRGIKWDGLAALWDWYATFSALAGVDATDHRAAKASLPPIDSHDLSAFLLGKTLASPRAELPIGTEPRLSNLSSAPLCASYNRATPYYDEPSVVGDEPKPLPDSPPPGSRCTTVSALIVDEGKGGLWKLLTGTVEQAMYTGPAYPNSTTDEVSSHFVSHCGDGCLFELRADPLETSDLASRHPQRLARLRAKLEAYEATAFNPDRGGNTAAACEHAQGVYRGFWGPFMR